MSRLTVGDLQLIEYERFLKNSQRPRQADLKIISDYITYILKITPGPRYNERCTALRRMVGKMPSAQEIELPMPLKRNEESHSNLLDLVAESEEEDSSGDDVSDPLMKRRSKSQKGHKRRDA